MSLGLRGKLFIISLIAIGGVGGITLVFFDALWVRALLGVALAIFLSGLASELMTRALRAMVDEAVGGATGRGPGNPADSGDDLVPHSRSFREIGRELRDTVSELAEERDRLETIVEQMRDAVLVLDGDGRLSLTNDAANTLLAIDDDDVGRPLRDAVRSHALLRLAERAAKESDSDITEELEIEEPKRRDVIAQAASIRNDGGVVIVMHDVTEIRRLERVRRDFVANVSHELRTPVAVIRANAETLLDGALSDADRARGFVEGVHRSSERLSLLIADLLDLSRIEAGQYATDIKPMRLREAVDEVVDAIRTESTASVEVINEVTDGELVLADGLGLNQILQNLVDNAIKYAAEEGHVWVRAAARGDTLRIEVEDDGTGIEEKHQKRIFERFYRIDPGRSRRLGGTGLGLSIVKHLAERMGGAVGVEAATQGGCLFWVELPRPS